MFLKSFLYPLHDLFLSGLEEIGGDFNKPVAKPIKANVFSGAELVACAEEIIQFNFHAAVRKAQITMLEKLEKEGKLNIYDKYTLKKFKEEEL